jgi:hypothetical protein
MGDFDRQEGKISLVMGDNFNMEVKISQVGGARAITRSISELSRTPLGDKGSIASPTEQEFAMASYDGLSPSSVRPRPSGHAQRRR